VTACDLEKSFTFATNPPQSHFGKAHHYPSWQRMHSSAACASCAMSTADKSSYSAVGTLHPYHVSPLTHRFLYHCVIVAFSAVFCVTHFCVYCIWQMIIKWIHCCYYYYWCFFCVSTAYALVLYLSVRPSQVGILPKWPNMLSRWPCRDRFWLTWPL